MNERPKLEIPDCSDISPEYIVDSSQPDPKGWNREKHGPFPYPSDSYAEKVQRRFDKAISSYAKAVERQARKDLAEASGVQITI